MRRRVLSLTSILVATATVSMFGWTSSPTGPGEATVRAAEGLARFDAVDLSGERWAPIDFKGRVTLIDFWATWCAPCLADLPDLKALYAEHDRGSFQILGVSLDAASRPRLVSFLNRHRVDWPQIHERGYGGPIATAFGIDRLPATVLVRSDGTVEAINLRGPALRARIKALTAAPARIGS